MSTPTQSSPSSPAQDSTFAILHPEGPTPTLPDERFFEHDYPRDPDAFCSFAERLEHDAEASRPYLRAGSPYPIHVVAEICSGAFVKEDANITITLTRPLQTGFCKWAQVWRANLRWCAPHEDAMSNSESDRGAHVVIKIFQESAFRPPEYFDEDGIESGYWRTGAKQARAEALAYVCMRSLQGREVPWSYGFFKVRLPHGELAYAHVMEFMDAMASCLYAVIKCGVVQKDVTCENMIIRPGAAQPVVFVDFAAMQSLRSPSVGPVRDPELIEWDVSNDVASLVRAFRKMAVQMSDIAAWLEDRAHRGAPWTRLFAFLTEKMPRWYDLFAIETDEFIALNPEVEQEAR